VQAAEAERWMNIKFTWGSVVFFTLLRYEI
jgi:hypothetical protein